MTGAGSRQGAKREGSTLIFLKITLAALLICLAGISGARANSFGNYTFTNPAAGQQPPPPAGTAATDLHFEPQQGNAEKYTVLGVGTPPNARVSPSDLNATYNLEGQGTGAIDIAGLSVGAAAPNNTLSIRIQSSSDKLPNLKVHWTYPDPKHPGVPLQGKEFNLRYDGAPAE
jgi:hypothetical protein